MVVVRPVSAPAAEMLGGRRRIFRGWWLLAASVGAMAIGSGVSFWSFGLYIEPLESEFGWSRTEVSLGFSVSFVVAGISGPAVGRWIDTRGARSAIVVGSVLATLSYALLAATGSLWQWYLYSSLNALARQLMFFIPFQALILRWFDRRRGIALGIFGTGFSLGGFVFVPLMGVLIESLGWRGGFIFSAVAIFVGFIPIGVLVVRNTPEEVGQVADGAPVPAVASEAMPSGEGVAASVALRTPLFWVLGLALMLFFFGIFGLLVHQVPLFESVGISRHSATAIVSVSSGAGILTRLAFSFLADRIRRFEVAAIALALVLMAGLVPLLLDSGPLAIGAFLVFWTAGRSGGPIMEAMLLTRAFGVRNFATLLGAIVVIEMLGQIVSPTAASAIFDATGSYRWALVMYLGSFSASIALFALALRIPRPTWDAT